MKLGIGAHVISERVWGEKGMINDTPVGFPCVLFQDKETYKLMTYEDVLADLENNSLQPVKGSMLREAQMDYVKINHFLKKFGREWVLKNDFFFFRDMKKNGISISPHSPIE